MYQAFRCSLIWPLAGMEIRGPGADHYDGLKALWSHRAFPGLDLTDQLTLPFVAGTMQSRGDRQISSS